MKIIEAMKKIKDLTQKAQDLQRKVQQHCANLDIETPMYPDTRAQITQWIQAHHDILKEILALRFAIQKTNIVAGVTIELGGVNVRKSIAEWIHRRRDLATMEMNIWAGLNDRNLKEGAIPSSTGNEPRLVKIVRHFDPRERDAKVDAFRSEPHVIDATLEVVNATTDLVQ